MGKSKYLMLMGIIALITDISRVVSLGYEPTYGVDRRTVQYAAYVGNFS